jgi:hypothetical protein
MSKQVVDYDDSEPFTLKERLHAWYSIVREENPIAAHRVKVAHEWMMRESNSLNFRGSIVRQNWAVVSMLHSRHEAAALVRAHKRYFQAGRFTSLLMWQRLTIKRLKYGLPPLSRHRGHYNYHEKG